jgi:hypothetical protein
MECISIGEWWLDSNSSGDGQMDCSYGKGLEISFYTFM